MGQLDGSRTTSHSVHARRHLKEGEVVMLYQGHVLTADEEKKYQGMLPPYEVRALTAIASAAARAKHTLFPT